MYLVKIKVQCVSMCHLVFNAGIVHWWAWWLHGGDGSFSQDQRGAIVGRGVYDLNSFKCFHSSYLPLVAD